MDRSSILLVSIPLALSAFTHIWNPIGFPSIFGNGNIDESEYLQRAMIVLNGEGLRDKSFAYDHPYFGQLFLAGVFKIIAYPHLFISSVYKGDIHSVEMLYLVPRVFMGILAVVDTFLVYKISERRYNRNVAFIASVLFAVMPMTWLLRRILLDSILLPFLLSSILFALYAKDSSSNTRSTIMVLLSGIFLGLAIFTKIPAFTMIPLVAFLLVYNSNNRSRNENKTEKLKALGLWLIPVIFIPSIWPIHAWSIGEYNLWLDGIHYQTHRTGFPLFDSIIIFFKNDPVLLVLGSVGLIFAAIKKDFLILLWAFPYLTLLYFAGFVQYFHIILLLPIFCIGSGRLIADIVNMTYRNKAQQKIRMHFIEERFHHFWVYNYHFDIFRLSQNRLMIIIISAIGIFGLVSTTLLITTNLNSSYFESIAFISRYLSYNNYEGRPTTIVSDVPYLWMQHYVLHKDHYYKLYWDTEPVRDGKIILMFDDNFLVWPQPKCCIPDERQMNMILNHTFPLMAFNQNARSYDSNKYPYTSISENRIPSKIEIRSNVLSLNNTPFLLQIYNDQSVAQVGRGLKIIVPANKPGLPSYWNDSSKNCENSFTCTVNFTTGWKDNTSLQVSTSSNENLWSYILGSGIEVKPSQQYQVVTHMKLNEFVVGSHIALEGYNVTSNEWNKLYTQCPVGTNGPLEWKEFRCDITIPKNVNKIRPVLKAGWSSEKGKEAKTSYDDIYIGNMLYKNKTHISTASSNLVSNPNFTHFDNSIDFTSLCQLRGDFDIQLDYKLLKWPLYNGVRIGLVVKESANENKAYNNPFKSMNRISFGSNVDLGGRQHEVYATYFNDGVHSINAIRIMNGTAGLPAGTMDDTTGKLRLARSGLVMTGYYYSNGRWVPLHSAYASPTDVTIVLKAGTGDFGLAHHAVEIALANYVVNKGHLVNCPSR